MNCSVGGCRAQSPWNRGFETRPAYRSRLRVAVLNETASLTALSSCSLVLIKQSTIRNMYTPPTTYSTIIRSSDHACSKPHTFPRRRNYAACQHSCTW
ncbi:hypothetical protein MPH_00091 [Macrophomina phaseolina MS6]|uniref:Uncharacterized protein n=1 Tax=Macrophomina phaseolina (strain MS6) TaxID=1126212 RepID=K2S6F9_MACPH|nr:hypothetical protein MPH_00091 [Macrophomina phaseolina MS6]